MKTKFLFILFCLGVLVACEPEPQAPRGDSYVGTWEMYETYDYQFKPIEITTVEQLCLNEDGTWWKSTDGRKESGTYVNHHVEDYTAEDGFSYGGKTYFELTSTTSVTPCNVFYSYSEKEDILIIEAEPGVTGVPTSKWKRVVSK